MNYHENFVSERIDRDANKFETIRQLAKRHMMDQYHTTTDEELQNAVVELDVQPFHELRSATVEGMKNR